MTIDSSLSEKVLLSVNESVTSVIVEKSCSSSLGHLHSHPSLARSCALFWYPCAYLAAARVTPAHAKRRSLICIGDVPFSYTDERRVARLYFCRNLRDRAGRGVSRLQPNDISRAVTVGLPNPQRPLQWL